MVWMREYVPRQMVAGAVAGAATQCLLHPLDVVKVRLQVQEQQGGAARELGKMMMNREGLRGLYRGITPSLLASGLSWGVYFHFYDLAKTRWFALLHGGGHGQQQEREEEAGALLSVRSVVHICSALQAGAIGVLITNPIWLVKTRMQLQRAEMRKDGVMEMHPKYRSTVHAFRTIVSEEGPLALYRGIVPALWLCWHGAIQFFAYEEFKILGEKFGIQKNYFFSEALIMGAASKVVASTVTYPAQVIKSRMQQLENEGASKYKGFFRSFNLIIRNEGIRGLYRGLGANLLRVAPNSGIMFMIYEFTISILPN